MTSSQKNIQSSYLENFKETLKEYSKINYCFPIRKYSLILERLALEFSCIVIKTKLGNLFLPELFSSCDIVHFDEYCYLIQENIFQLIGTVFYFIKV